MRFYFDGSLVGLAHCSTYFDQDLLSCRRLAVALHCQRSSLVAAGLEIWVGIEGKVQRQVLRRELFCVFVV